MGSSCDTGGCALRAAPLWPDPAFVAIRQISARPWLSWSPWSGPSCVTVRGPDPTLRCLRATKARLPRGPRNLHAVCFELRGFQRKKGHCCTLPRPDASGPRRTARPCALRAMRLPRPVRSGRQRADRCEPSRAEPSRHYRAKPSQRITPEQRVPAMPRMTRKPSRALNSPRGVAALQPESERRE